MLSAKTCTLLRIAKTRLAGMALLALLLSACVPSQHPGIAPQRLSTVLVENQSGQKVQVYDGAYLIVSLMPGERAIRTLYGTGARTLRVRSIAWNVESRVVRFEDNRSWRLQIDLNGTVHLDLRPSR